jgi:FKBP-type peptidyl-prolyl cis-trans isomerase
MKLHTTVLFAAAVCAVMSSCTGDVKETPSGFKVKYVEKGDGKLVKPGEIIMIDMAIIDQDDSAWYDNRGTGYPEMVRVADESTKATEHGVTEAFRMLSKGDSILLEMKAKDFFPMVWKSSPPADMSDDYLFTFQIKCNEIMDEATAMSFQMKQDSVHQANEAVRAAAYNTRQIARDTAIIDNYLKGKNIKAQTLPSGLRYVIRAKGTGRTINNGDVVKMKYAGQNLDGGEFDAGEYEFTVGAQQVIRGWDEIALIMQQGTALTVFIPSTMAYGAGGRPPVIMPEAVLIFDMEVLSIK